SRSREERPERSNYSDREKRPSRSREERPERSNYSDREKRPSRSREERPERSNYSDRSERRGRPQTTDRKPQTADRTPRKRRNITAESEILSEIVEIRRREGRPSPKKQKILSLEHEEKYGPIRLNKYISNSGICSRRDADMLIQTGAIQVNGQIVTELGTKVMPTDEVRYGDRILQREKPVYLLLNKPKDYITTMDDERDRKHVLELVKGACKERIYPVGRLDKNTTGLLLFTNDGEMTKKLTHPKHGIRKVYYVELNKNLAADDFEKIANGIELSDGEIKVDEIAYAGETKREIGITLHSGKNRIVRRIFEQLGYEVLKLDRVVFAGLTKKDLPRGKYRFLTEAEINILKMTVK
ncbi:MAG: pseudouridine synthase, partial [Bacteroidetes bacterium]|nr:pseudouridine synthase [Bacteroidota bacterium]